MYVCVYVYVYMCVYIRTFIYVLDLFSQFYYILFFASNLQVACNWKKGQKRDLMTKQDRFHLVISLLHVCGKEKQKTKKQKKKRRILQYNMITI